MAKVADADSNASQAMAMIKARVMDGTYGQGQRLTEDQLARELGTSRTPVREAMRLLVADGFLTFKPNSGTFVARWTPAEIRDIFELRTVLEGQVAAAAAERITPEAIARLSGIQDRIEACTAAPDGVDLAQVGALNREFHQVFAEASGRPRLVATLRSAIEAPIVQRTFRRYSADQLRRSFSHHRELIEAFRARDPVWARATLECHVRAAYHAVAGAANEQS